MCLNGRDGGPSRLDLSTNHMSKICVHGKIYPENNGLVIQGNILVEFSNILGLKGLANHLVLVMVVEN